MALTNPRFPRCLHYPPSARDFPSMASSPPEANREWRTARKTPCNGASGILRTLSAADGGDESGTEYDKYYESV